MLAVSVHRSTSRCLAICLRSLDELLYTGRVQRGSCQTVIQYAPHGACTLLGGWRASRGEVPYAPMGLGQKNAAPATPYSRQGRASSLSDHTNQAVVY